MATTPADAANPDSERPLDARSVTPRKQLGPYLSECQPSSPPASPHLGALRTVMAADRSLMAWVRTALSMIGFGFTIYKVLEGMKGTGTDVGDPRYVGLFLIGLGVLSLIMGSTEYRATLKDLGEIEAFPPWRFSMIVATILSASGILLFGSILARLL